MTQEAATTQTESKPRKRRGIEWGFVNGGLTILTLALWTELLVFLAGGARSLPGNERWLHAGGFFLAVLPVLGAAVYQWPSVFGFFRSVKVGVVNLSFIGLGAIAGVMWHQEDPFFPIPPDDGRPIFENGRYNHYLDFRAAHAFFIYHATKNNVFSWLPGTEEVPTVDMDQVETAMANLSTRLPELKSRFGEEFEVAIETSSRRGLQVRQENEAVKAFEVAWDDAWYTLWVWSDRLDLVRVYKSDWYAAFWVILFCGVLSNTFRGGWRRLLRPGKYGFVITHAGVMLIIIGGGWGRFTEERGILELHIGESDNQFRAYDGRWMPFTSGSERPFGVRLDAFRADHFDVLEIVYVKDNEFGELDYEFALDRQPKARVYEGQQLTYDRDAEGEPQLQLEVVEYVQQAMMEREIRPAEPGDRPVIPLARLVARGAESMGGEILSPILPRPLQAGDTGVRWLYSVAESQDEAYDTLAAPVETRFGSLKPMTMGTAVPHESVDVTIGKRIQVDDGSGRVYDVQILDAVPALRLDRNEAGDLDHEDDGTPIELQRADNPAVKIRISDGSGSSEERWVLEEQFMHSERVFPGLDFQFAWDEWASPAAARWILFHLPDDSLVAGEVGRPDSLIPVDIGDLLPSPGAEVTLREAYREGVPTWNFHALEGADFFHPAGAAIRVRATTPDGEREFVMQGVSGSPPEFIEYTAADGSLRKVLLRFHPDLDDLPYEWRSRLTVLESEGAHGEFKPVDSGEIRVNDFYTYKGYNMFQTNARADDPTYSGIGIVYDPGMNTVLVGLYMLALGTIVVFLIKPIFTRKQRGI